MNEQAWLDQQPEILVIEYTIWKIEDSFSLLRQHGIFGVKAIKGCYNLPFSTLITVPLKHHDPNLAFIYIQARPNPFGKRYQYRVNSTINDFKQQKLTIQAIFIFKFDKDQIQELLIDELY